MNKRDREEAAHEARVKFVLDELLKPMMEDFESVWVWLYTDGITWLESMGREDCYQYIDDWVMHKIREIRG